MSQKEFYSGELVVYTGTRYVNIKNRPGIILSVYEIEGEDFADVNFNVKSENFAVIQKTVKISNLKKIKRISLKLRKYFPMFGVLIETNEKSELFLRRKELFFNSTKQIVMEDYELVTLDLKNSPYAFEWSEYLLLMKNFNYLFEPCYKNDFNANYNDET